MKIIHYSMVCLICGLLVITAGCKKTPVTVVNTRSGVLINSSDFTGGLQQKAIHKANTASIEQVSQPTAKSTGNVIHLGGGYEKIEMGPLFD